MHDAVVVVSVAVVLAIGAAAMLNVAMTSKVRLMQAWSMMYIFAMLCVIATAFAPWLGRDSLLNIVPNVAAVGAVGGLWSGCVTFNQRRPRLLVVWLFLLVTGIVTALEVPQFGESAGASVTMAAIVMLAVASGLESINGDLAKRVNARVITIVCGVGAAWTTARLTVFAIDGPGSEVFAEYFNPTMTAVVCLISYTVVAFTTAMLAAARTGSVTRRSPTTTFAMGVLDWTSFVAGARDRVARVRHAGEHTAVLAVVINGLEEINITYGAAFGDDVIRALADFLRRELHPTTIIGYRGGGRFVVVGIVAEPQDGERRALELLDALVGVTVAGKKGFRLGVRIGTSDSFSEEHEFDALLAAATAACARAQAATGSRVETSVTGTDSSLAP
ncbi:GGDEF domain-containing protein [Mycetocola zhujimingii]|uniref:GGDEF domain-containing protein n=1 Tax=Mycetocola zhujimingii TaxID=2079792 RepID=A0A2U1TFM8_9MICO|nr:GGDEF domain-containing protein [Mycetocola zhujimingii]PWC07676.1 hypothetical protein DF223_05165 [Mycetocola zhujimingii]